MLKNRVIPVLLLSDKGLVKTTKFDQRRYVGDVLNAIKIFNEKEVDELILLDIDAARNRHSPNFDLIEKLAGECFIPLCYGGGITTLDEASRLFTLGIEKVSLQSATFKDMSLVTAIAQKHGSQSVVVSIDVKKNWLGKFKQHPNGGAYLEHIHQAIRAGAGEILLTSVDRDGTRSGMELSLIQEVSNSISVPLIAVGGVGELAHIKEAIQKGASAVGAGSFFVFYGPHQAVLLTYPKYHELEKFLRSP